MTYPLSPARSRLERASFYLVTHTAPKALPLDQFLRRVLEGGVDVVQLREKEMEAGELLGHCEHVRRATEEFGALFVVNDRVDVAVASGADGVHLGQNDLPTGDARHQMGPKPLVGLSTHSRREVDDAEPSEADYIGVGPIHSTPTKPARLAVGYELIGYARERFTRPYFAIGGIDLATLPRALEAGATRVAVLRALTEADDPGRVAGEISKMLQGVRNS